MGEGRSDGGVLHLHPRGQARYPEGGRRREDEPQGKGRAFAPNAGDESTRAMRTWRTSRTRGCRPAPRVYGSDRPAFSPLPFYADAAGSSLHQRGEPRTPSWVVHGVPVACPMRWSTRGHNGYSRATTQHRNLARRTWTRTRRRPDKEEVTGSHPGCRPAPRGVWAVAPAVSTPHCLRGTRQDLPCTSAGNPAPRGRAFSVPLAPVTSGSPRSPPGTRQAGQAA